MTAIRELEDLAGTQLSAVCFVRDYGRRAPTAGPEIAQFVPTRDGRPAGASMITWENLAPTR